MVPNPDMRLKFVIKQKKKSFIFTRSASFHPSILILNHIISILGELDYSHFLICSCDVAVC